MQRSRRRPALCSIAIIACGAALPLTAYAAEPALEVRELIAVDPSGQPNEFWRFGDWGVTDISEDGSTIVGRYVSYAPFSHSPPPASIIPVGFIWRPADASFQLVLNNATEGGDPQNPDDNIGLPLFTSSDGSRIAFASQPTLGMSPFVSVRERATGFPRVFAYPTDATQNLVAFSANGHTLLMSQTWNYKGQDWAVSWRWTSDSQTYLQYKEPAWTNTFSGFQALRASSDLSRVFVRVIAPASPFVAKYYSSVLAGPEQIYALNGTGKVSAMSGNGQVIVGALESTGKPTFPMLWQADNPRLRLSLPKDAYGGSWNDTSGSGEVAVGTYKHQYLPITRPMIWIKPRGNRDLLQVLAKFNIQLPANIAVRSAIKVSDDGTRIVGFAAGSGPNIGKVYVYRASIPASEVCYCNCDGSTGPNYLNDEDVLCFQQRLAQKQYYTNCDNSVDADGKPTYDAADFQCFLDRFQAGCAVE